MGWLFTHKPKSQSVIDFFKETFDHDNDRQTGEIIDCATVGWSEAYIAYRVTQKKNGRIFVIGIVCMIRHQANDSMYNFGYKDMDETMGPNIRRCPERILRQLSALDQIETDMTCSSYKWAKQWRQDCWGRIERGKAVKKVKAGAIIRFERPIQFTNGIERDTFQIHSKKGHRVLLASEGSDYPAYRITRENMISRPFTILKAA